MLRIDIPIKYLDEEYIESGKTSRQIAKQLGCDKSTVLRRLRESGIEIKPPRKIAPNDGMTRAARHYAKKKTDQEWVKKQRDSNKKSLEKYRGKYRRHQRDDRLLFLFSYQAQVGCEKCGETNPIVLQFHHRPGTNKLFGVGNTSSRERKWDIILAELEKCDVLCANCHRLVHWDEMHGDDTNWASLALSAGADIGAVCQATGVDPAVL